MVSESRTANSIKNLVGNYATQILTLLLGFVNRSLFLYCLSVDYLGLNSLFSSVISMLSLAELGIGSAITFHLYKPISNNDTEHIKALVNFYKICYTAIGLIIFLLGLCLLPILHNIVNFETNVDVNLYVIYILYLFNTAMSYWFFAYLGTVISAHQKQYVIYKIRSAFKIITVVICITVLYISRNYYIYIFTQSTVILIENIYIRNTAYKMYPYLKKIANSKLEMKEIKSIGKDVWALTISKISSMLSSGVDSIIISTFVSTTMVGYISNYDMINRNIISMANAVSSSSIAGIGNLVAEGDKEKQIRVFKQLDFINFYLLYFVCVCLITLSGPFIALWLGKEFVIDNIIVICSVLNFYVLYSLNVVWVFKDGMGLFKYGKFVQIIQGIANLILSIILCKHCGAMGVYLASLLTNLAITSPMFIYYLFKYGFNRSVIRHLFVTVYRFGFVGGVLVVIHFVCKIGPANAIYNFIYKLIVTVVIANVSFIIIFGRTNEFKDAMIRIKTILIRDKKH